MIAFHGRRETAYEESRGIRRTIVPFTAVAWTDLRRRPGKA